MKQSGDARGRLRSVLIDIGPAPAVGPPADGTQSRARSSPARPGRCRWVAARAVAAAALLALAGAALPAVLDRAAETYAPGMLEPYPVEPSVAWEVSASIADRGTSFLASGTVLGGADGEDGLWDLHRGSAAVAAVQTLNKTSDLLAIDVRDGSTVWAVAAEPGATIRSCSDSMLDGALVCIVEGSATDGLGIVAFRTGERRAVTRWSAPTGSRAIEVTGGTVLLAGASADGGSVEIGRFEAWTGAERWHQVLPLGPVGRSEDASRRAGEAPVLVAVGSRVIVSVDAVVAVLDAETGQLLQEPRAGSATSLADGGAFVAYPSGAAAGSGNAATGLGGQSRSTTGELYPADGTDVVLLSDARFWVAPALGRDPGTALVLDGTEGAVAVDSADGRLLWSSASGVVGVRFFPAAVTPAGVLGTLSAGLAATPGRIQLRDLQTGAPLWTGPLEPHVVQRVVGWDGQRIVVVRLDIRDFTAELAAFDSSTGTQEWKLDLGAGEVVAAAGGRLVRVSPDRLRGLAPSGG